MSLLYKMINCDKVLIVVIAVVVIVFIINKKQIIDTFSTGWGSNIFSDPQNYVVFTGTDTDIDAPVKDTLQNCKDKCATESTCLGFSRKADVSPTDSSQECYFKKKLSPSTYFPNNKGWNTIEKLEKGNEKYLLAHTSNRISTEVNELLNFINDDGSLKSKVFDKNDKNNLIEDTNTIKINFDQNSKNIIYDSKNNINRINNFREKNDLPSFMTEII